MFIEKSHYQFPSSVGAAQMAEHHSHAAPTELGIRDFSGINFYRHGAPDGALAA
jgi:hypothetical protein